MIQNTPKNPLLSMSRVVLFTATLFCGANNVNAGDWKNAASLYFWLPSIDGELVFPPPPENPDDEPLPVDPSEVLDSLDMVFMGSYELQYKKIVMMADVVYLDMSNDNTVDIQGVSRDVSLGLEAWQTTVYGGYRVFEDKRSSFDILGGIRYLSMDLSFDLHREIIEEQPRAYDVGLLDALIGFKGQYGISEHWFIPYLGDVGTGDSDLTYQLSSGIGYGGSWGDVTVTYRYLAWEDGGGILNSFILSGGAIGYRYHF